MRNICFHNTDFTSRKRSNRILFVCKYNTIREILRSNPISVKVHIILFEKILLSLIQKLQPRRFESRQKIFRQYNDYEAISLDLLGFRNKYLSIGTFDFKQLCVVYKTVLFLCCEHIWFFDSLDTNTILNKQQLYPNMLGVSLWRFPYRMFLEDNFICFWMDTIQNLL